MDGERRRRAIEVLERHGYTRFTDDLRVARVHGPGRFDERVAVHWEEGAYVLCVRRGGAEHLQAVAEEVGQRVNTEPVLKFSGLDLSTLEAKLAKVLAALQRHPKGASKA